MADTPKKKVTKARKPKAVPSHPPVLNMIKAAISNLKDRNGSSRQAIVKYIQANYKVDVQKLAPHIKKQLKVGVDKGLFLHTKGIGASGSFKLSLSQKAVKAAKPKSPKKKKKPAKKTAAAAGGASPAAKKPKVKRAAKPKKPKSPKKPKAAKPKKAKKSPAKKKATKAKKPTKK